MWYRSRLAHKPIDFSLSFSSRRVRLSGSVDDIPVNNITVDTAIDVPVVSLAWLWSHPTLRAVPVKPVPPAAVALRAANAEPIKVVGFVDFPFTLSEITRTVTALVALSLGPDLMLLDNSVMSDFGAILDWENETLSFSSTGATTPAVHRIRENVPTNSNILPSWDHTQNMSVAAVHRDADADAAAVSLCERVDLKPEHEGLAVAYADCLPPEDCTVVVEPLVVTEKDVADDAKLEPFKHAIVARTIATWKASDGSVVVQIADPCGDGVCLSPGLCLGHLSAVSIVTPDQLHVDAVANTPAQEEEVRRARSNLGGPLSKAFSNSTFSDEQQEVVLDLCAKYRPVSLPMSELGRCSIAEATVLHAVLTPAPLLSSTSVSPRCWSGEL